MSFFFLKKLLNNRQNGLHDLLVVVAVRQLPSPADSALALVLLDPALVVVILLTFSSMNSTSGSVRALLLWRFGFSSHSSPFSVDLRFFVSLYRSKAFCLMSSALLLSSYCFLDCASRTLFKLSSFTTSSSSKTSISDMSSTDIPLAVSSWCILALYFFWRRTHRSLTALLSLR